jgi:very-short-patch-repair endonuclease
MKFERSLCCVICRKFKPESLGKLVKSRTRHNHKYFVCDHCRLTPPIRRHHRENQETPPEREVREALMGCGFSVEAEFKVGRFIYDFAVPKIRLLIEVDSNRYHRLPRQIKRDRLKDKCAHEQHWKLVRVKTSGAGSAALAALQNRAQELGFGT